MKVIIENSYYEIGDIRTISGVKFIKHVDRYNEKTFPMKGIAYNEVEVNSIEEAESASFEILFYNDIPSLNISSYTLNIEDFINKHSELIQLWSENQKEYLSFKF